MARDRAREKYLRFYVIRRGRGRENIEKIFFKQVASALSFAMNEMVTRLREV